VNTEIAILSLIVALLSVVLSPLVSLAIARRSNAHAFRVAKKNLVSPMRQKWIDSVRDPVAELSSQLWYYYIAGADHHPKGPEIISKIHFLERRLRLLLNPAEEDHKRLSGLFQKAIASVEFKRASEQEMAKLDAEITECAQRILKTEWKRVKDED
jgi:hypothetical protein